MRSDRQDGASSHWTACRRARGPFVMRNGVRLSRLKPPESLGHNVTMILRGQRLDLGLGGETAAGKCRKATYRDAAAAVEADPAGTARLIVSASERELRSRIVSASTMPAGGENGGVATDRRPAPVGHGTRDVVGFSCGEFSDAGGAGDQQQHTVHLQWTISGIAARGVPARGRTRRRRAVKSQSS